MQDQMAQARKIALSHSSIATIETESFFHGKEAYLSFIGKDQEGQELAVLVAQADDAVYTYPLKEGVGSKEAAYVVKEKSQDAIDRVTFGRFKGKPIVRCRTEDVMRNTEGFLKKIEATLKNYR